MSIHGRARREAATASRSTARSNREGKAENGLLALQRAAGNRAVSGLLSRSRLDRWDLSDVVDVLGGPATVAVKYALGDVFDTIVASNRASSAVLNVPPAHQSALTRYAAANPADGARLLPGFLRFPVFHQGGWILDVQGNAAAMTLGRDVFVSGALEVDTYVHEMVHVTQYAEVGPVNFLVNYFGTSAVELARRLMERKPLDMMTASTYEREAYALEDRFKAWHANNP